MDRNGNGNGNGNGKGSGGTLPTLAGAHILRYEEASIHPSSLADLMNEIHRLGQTGSVTIHVVNGTSRKVEFRREVTREQGDA